MSKRMKDPKGDLRFVHKLAQPYGFRVLKLTAMDEQAGSAQYDVTKDVIPFIINNKF